MNKRPKFYGGPDNAYEVIKVIQAWGLSFELGNVLKYIRRAKEKHDDPLEDLKKARQYLDFEIEKHEKPNIEVKMGCEVKGLESLEKLKINLDKYAAPPHVPMSEILKDHKEKPYPAEKWIQNTTVPQVSLDKDGVSRVVKP